MVFNGQLTGFTVDEDQNGPPSQVAPWTDDDLFIQSDNEVTPMTDIEDSSGDEVYDEEYLRMHMKSAHDEVKSGLDVQQLGIPRTTKQIKNAVRENTPSPSFENTTGRHSYSRNEEEELDDLKGNPVHTRVGIIHGNSVNSPWPRLDPNEKVKTKAIPSDLEQISTGHQDSVRDARPTVCGADIQTTHGQTTVYKYDGDFRSDSICQDHIKKESHTQEKESDVNMAETLPFPTRLDRPENDKIRVNLSKSVAPSATHPSVHLQQKTPGKGISQQDMSSPRHKKHQKKKRGPKPKPGKVCTICKKRFPSSELKQHMQQSHRHSCQICRKTIKDLVMFQGHMREHAGEPTPFWCDQCNKRFDRYATLDKHRRVHSLKGRWECSKCGKVITRHDNYLRHLKVHEDSNLNKCEKCGRQYASAVNLRKHMVVHLEEKPIECPVCEKRFNFKSTLDYHMRSHTAATVKSATCKICGMECIHKSSLAIHMNIHTGMKPHVCVYCGKRFAQLSTKIGHEMNHENPNKKSLDKDSEEQRTKNMLESFDCDECLMSFISLELLNGHMMKTHDTTSKEIPDSEVTPECIKPYSCGICEMPFLSVSGLRKHRIKNHPEHIGVGKGRYSSLGKNLNSNGKTMADKTVSTEKKGAATRSARNRKKGSKEANVNLGRASTKGNNLYDTETADQPTLDSETDPADDLPTPKQKPVPTKDLPKSKQGSTDGESDSNIDKNKCNICGKLVLELRNHMKYHSEKAYVCRVCGMRFAISANLKRHLRQHTGETPFQCKTCGERFMKAEALKKHMARHKGEELEKKYECSICGKKFLDNYHLNRHSVVHNSWPKVRDTDPANGDK
ncbi:zinc finger protein 184-like [Haliotis rubra]|uniref:zinc finger protein 184-like n=1 Tax=Haliotis rubra TaxID=36100 RepID=UPI001EE51CD2|nr:zinc finger protein 184-like [Haliotis rubra]